MHRALTPVRTVLGLLPLLLTLAFAQGQSPLAWRALYLGAVGGEPVTLDLAIADDGVAFARLTLHATAETLDGAGRSDPDSGALELAFAPATDAPPSVALDYAFLRSTAAAAEPAPDPELLLTGTRHLEWTDDGDELTVALTRPGGRPAHGTLARSAQYVSVTLREGRIEAGYALPRFAAAPGLARRLETAARERMTAFVAEGRALIDAGDGLGWGWTQHEATDVMGAAGEYLSLLTSFYYYTGGAHPNSHAESLLVRVTRDGARAVPLAELFAAGSGWLERVGALVLEDLAAQEAAWVTNGDVSELSEADLGVFTLGPTGLTFHFAPYAMGPYAQGPFRVTLPYAALTALAAPDGPLPAFAGERGAADAQR